MAFQELCPPALIYVVFSTTQVIIDSVKGYYNLALMKLLVSLIFTILLNYLCSLGLGIISWLIVFIPFILMTVIVSMLLLMFGLDPTTGKLNIYDENSPNGSKNKRESELQKIENTYDRDVDAVKKYMSGDSSSPEGVYVDSPKGGKNAYQPATSKDTIDEMEKNKLIKIIIDSAYSITNNKELSQYLMSILDQCKNLTAKQCSNIWLSQVEPIMKASVGVKQSNAIQGALSQKFISMGYSEKTTIGEIIIGGYNSSKAPSTQQQNVLNDATRDRADVNSITTTDSQ